MSASERSDKNQPRQNQPVEELIQRALSGDRGAIGRLLSVAEAGGDRGSELTELTFGPSRGAHIVGITGAPGSGKSTMVGQLVALLVSLGSKPAVLAVDPSSPLTGGAILGDRVRMTDIDDVAFIRSVATRGHAGGLAMAIPGCVRVFDTMGFDPVVIETVGVGQVEVDVTAAADTTLVVVTPGMGDAVQANKAGLLEVADIFVVNKSDRPGASDARRDLELMLDLSHVTGQEDVHYRPPILMANSLAGEGIPEVAAAIEAHRQYLNSSGLDELRRAKRARFELTAHLQQGFESALEAKLDSNAELINNIAAGKVSPTAAVDQIARELIR